MKLTDKIFIGFVSCTLFAALSFTGCKKFVTIPPAPNLITSTQVFADSADANAAVLGMYVNMAENTTGLNPINGGVAVYTGLSSDEIATNYDPDESSIYANQIISSNSTLEGVWESFYKGIYEVNSIIEGLTASKTVSTSAKNQYIGEAEFVRALSYFHLVNLYGAVPLATTTNYQVNAALPRSPVNTVYTQIVADLKNAQALLGVNYPTAGRVRANRYAATALLAKVYLYQKDWADAATQASVIINSGVYGLVTNLNSVFLAGSNEAILQLQPTQIGYETGFGYNFVPGTTNVIPTYTVDSFLLSAFESGDLRKADWLNSNTVGGVTYYYPYKYKLGYDGSTTPLEDIMVFRLAEQYLIRAEAEEENNDPGDAITDLNTIRVRAGLPPTTVTSSSTQAEILAVIYHEDQIEMFCEGNRWYDLKRTGNINAVMGSPGNICQAKGGTWNPDWALYPLPLDQFQLDPFLTQNAGY